MAEPNGYVPTAQEKAENIQELINVAFVESPQSVGSSPSEQGLTKFVSAIKERFKNVLDKIAYSIEKPFDILDNLLEFDEEKIAEILEAYGISVNQWVFSKGNLKTIYRLIKLIYDTFKDTQQIGILSSIRYLAVWTIIQELYNKLETIHQDAKSKSQPEQDAAGIAELKLIQEECMYYTRFAHGAYGNLINSILSGKDVLKVFDLSILTKQFLKKAELTQDDLFYAFWAATPYRPAYAIVRDQKKKSIILCMRGSENWADFITDLDCQYVDFSLVKDNETQKTFLRFKYNNNTPPKFKHTLGITTKLLNGVYSSETVSPNEIVLQSGYAHIGMFVAAIQSFKEITPRLKQIFSDSTYKDYNLVITGHSLGGGMTTLMTFLYTVHPFETENKNLFNEMRGYAFAPAPVLSTEFDYLLKDKIKSVAFGYDCVPTLSFGAAKDLSTVQLMLAALDKEHPGFIREILDTDIGENFESMHRDHIEIAKKEIQLYLFLKNSMKTSLKLHPMGRTFKIDQVDKAKKDSREYKFAIWEVEDKQHFEEIRLSKNLIQHHFPYHYEDALSSKQVDFRPITANKKRMADATGS